MPPPRRLALPRIATKPKSVSIAGDTLEVNIGLTSEQEQDLQDLLDFIEQGIPVPDRYYRASTGRRSDELLIKHNIMHLHLGGPHSDALVYLIQYEDAVMLICVDRHIHLEDHPVGKRFRVDRIRKAERKMQGHLARDTAEEPRSEQDERPQTPEHRD